MRYLLYGFVLIFFTIGAWASDFQKIDIPTTANINKIFFSDDYNGWAVTDDGEVLSTYDGGKTWTNKKVASRAINDIYVLKRRGYLVGDRGLLMMTTNGGARWDDHSLNIKYKLNGVGILDDSTALVCGVNLNSISKIKGETFRTTNYGRTWERQKFVANGLVDMAVNPPFKVFLLGSKQFHHSINKGLVYFPGKYEGAKFAYGFQMMQDFGFIVGADGFFAHTQDHGRHWEKIDTDLDKNLYAVDMYDNKSGIAVGEEGVIFEFEQNGKYTKVVDSGYENDLNTICITREKIFIGGDDGLLLVKDRFANLKK